MCCGKLPLLSTAFCGCSLRLGSIIIAWIQMVIHVIFLVAIFFFLVMGANTISEIKNNKQYPPMNYDNEKAINRAAGIGAIVITIIGVIFLIQLIATILLLIGVQKRKPGYMIFWMVMAVIGLVCTLGSIRMGSLTSIVFFIINAYFTWVIYSYYRQLKDCPDNTIQSVQGEGKIHGDVPQFVTPNAPPAYSYKPEHHV